MNTWLSVALAVVGGLMLTWLLVIAAMLIVRPRGSLFTEAIRLLPDLLRLIPRLARDPDLPRGARVRLWLLLAYLAMPIDLVPDFIPVLGYADDAIVVAAVLRAIVRRASPHALNRHWPGTDDGLAAVRRLAGLPAATTP
ncbi:YkvA family protein [Streptomyces mutabilis]|uniref:YkvA family protein n=1 Tax=Streptomyces mutabilis TaxID=67332 RepID=UPI001996BA90|nr:DUF1232 domain-containing protein [Streptomyces mutabilis]GGQ19850.1 hypothetical protein GCM10010279_29620 [Streptomyces mutabilis]